MIAPWIILFASCGAIVGSVYLVEKCYVMWKERKDIGDDGEEPIITPYVLAT